MNQLVSPKQFQVASTKTMVSTKSVRRAWWYDENTALWAPIVIAVLILIGCKMYGLI
jgi:hypothetical protein